MPQPVAAGQSAVIALVSNDSGFSETVPVGMGGQTVMMTIDTGAMIGMHQLVAANLALTGTAGLDLGTHP